MGKESEQNQIPYADYEWVEVQDTVLTIGISEDGLDDIGSVRKAELPEEGTVVDAEEIFGELETEDGPVHLYAPVKGTVVEVNSSVIESAEIISEDPQGDGWLVRIEAESKEDVQDFIDTHGKDLDSDDDDDDFDEEDEDDFEDDYDDEDEDDED